MKIEQEIMEMFDERYIDLNSPSGCNQADFDGFPNLIWDIQNNFISHIITLVQNREREEMLEKIKETQITIDTIIKLIK